MIKQIWKWLTYREPPEHMEQYKLRVSENSIDHSTYRDILSYLDSIGLKEQPDHWDVHNIRRGYYEAHSFYYSITCHTTLDNIELIEAYVASVPKMNEAERRRSEAHHDAMLSAGATMIRGRYVRS